MMTMAEALRVETREVEKRMVPERRRPGAKCLTAAQLIPFYAEQARKGCAASQARLEALRKEAQAHG